MSRTINRSELLGRVGTEPELRQTRNGTAPGSGPGQAVCRMRLATDRRSSGGETQTDWHNLVVWGKTARPSPSTSRRATGSTPRAGSATTAGRTRTASAVRRPRSTRTKSSSSTTAMVPSTDASPTATNLSRACSHSRRCVRSRRVLWSWAVSGFRWNFFPGVVRGRSPVHRWGSWFSFFSFFQVFPVWLREFWSVVVRICADWDEPVRWVVALCGGVRGRTGLWQGVGLTLAPPFTRSCVLMIAWLGRVGAEAQGLVWGWPSRAFCVNRP